MKNYIVSRIYRYSNPPNMQVRPEISPSNFLRVYLKLVPKIYDSMHRTYMFPMFLSIVPQFSLFSTGFPMISK